MLGVLPWPWLKRWWATHHLHACAVIANRVIFSRDRGPKIAVLSVLVHVLTVVIAWCVVQSIAAPVLFGQVFQLMPPVMLITMLPISIAGWGVREATMGLAFGYAGLMTNEGVNISLLFGAVSFIVGAFGGLVWIFSAEKAAQGATPIEVPRVPHGRMTSSNRAVARRRSLAALVSAGVTWAIRPLLLRMRWQGRMRALASHPDAAGRGHRGDRGDARSQRRDHRLAGRRDRKSPSSSSRRRCSSPPSASPTTSVRFRCCRGCCCRRPRSAPSSSRRPTSSHRSGYPALDRARPAAAGRSLVREPRQFHGRAGPDDRRRSSCRSPRRVVLLGWLGEVPASTTIVAAALCGAMLGFAPFNRPVAKIFLGDVGSLPIGLLLGWCLLQLAWHRHLAAALLLPLYYLTDATVTLFRRMCRREPFWAAHRSHFYQRATDNGFTVLARGRRGFRAQYRARALAIDST